MRGGVLAWLRLAPWHMSWAAAAGAVQLMDVVAPAGPVSHLCFVGVAGSGHA